MIANPAIPAAVPATLNDFRVHSSIAKEPSSTSAMAFSGLVLAMVLATGAFVWLDPLRLFTPTEATPPAPAVVPSAEPPKPIERQEIITPPTPVLATTSIEIPVAPVVQAPHVIAPMIRPRAAAIKPESRGSPMGKTNTTVPEASPKEKTALPLLLTNPEEKTDAPIVLKLGDDAKNAPKPAATNDQTPVTE
jgi:hypothetical protein